MKLYKSSINQLAQIMSIINDAKSTMKDMNLDQWQNNNPNEDVIINDIKNGNSYVVAEGNAILAHASLIFEKEPTYNKIFEGLWKSEQPYATIHRVATAKAFKNKGVASFVFSSFAKICLEKGVCWLRIDTHKDNIPMQNLINKYGFIKSGIIFVSENAERIAYEKHLISL